MPRSETTSRRQMVTIDQAADFLSCSPRTVRRMISRGEITGFRIGSHMLRIDLAELEAQLRPVPTADGGRGAA